MGNAQKPRRRRWLRFSLRGFIVFITVLGILLGIHQHRVRTQRDAVAKLAELGVMVLYEYEITGSDSRWPPDWLVTLLGKDNCLSVIWATIDPDEIDDKTPDNLKLAVDQLVRLPRLRVLNIGRLYSRKRGPKFTEWRQLARLVQVESLHISGGFDVDSIAELAAMPRLKHLFFGSVYFSDEEIEALARIKSLESLTVSVSGPDNKRRLRERLPNIALHFNIYWH